MLPDPQSVTAAQMSPAAQGVAVVQMSLRSPKNITNEKLRKYLRISR
jgi:hypothetical protein